MLLGAMSYRLPDQRVRVTLTSWTKEEGTTYHVLTTYDPAGPMSRREALERMLTEALEHLAAGDATWR